MAASPIETIPLFVRAGSVGPLGVAVESADALQTIGHIRVDAGVDGDFTLYKNDGKT